MKNTTFLNNELVSELLSVSEDPCISIYLPTHRNFSEKKHDLNLFKSLVREAEKALSENYSETGIHELLEPFDILSFDHEFWNTTLDGIALFNSPGYFKIIALNVPVEPLTLVGSSFYTKPLRHYLQSLDRFHVLGLSLSDFKLYEGNRQSLREIKLASGIPQTLEAALGEELTEKQTSVASFGGNKEQNAGVHHGVGDKKAELEKDTERFFRIVARNVEEHYSKPTGWPLLLASLPEHQSMFRMVNKNDCLHSKAISINPAAVSIDTLHKMAREIFEPEYDEKLNAVVERYHQAKAGSKGSDIAQTVARAAFEGKIDTLLVEENRMIAVRISNLVSGKTDIQNMNKPGIDDLIDELGELVALKGGKVIVLPKDKMPTDTGIAAIFRY